MFAQAERQSEPEGGRESLSDGRLCELLVCEKLVSLRRFCRAFMAGEPSRTLEYSIAAQRLLERITKDDAPQPVVE